MRKLLTSLFLFALFNTAFAQVPESFFYQAVARDDFGQLLQNQNVSFRLSIREGSLGGTILYREVHAATTNDYGLVNLEVGTGLVDTGTFSLIDWGSNSHFLQVEFDPAGGFTFIPMGGSQLISVPYALHAKTADNVDDADADPLNEIQDISLIGSDLSISGGSTITLPSGGGSSTLDDAYDGGGSGLGRVITADAGAVEVSTSTPNGIAVDLSSNSSTAIPLRVRNLSAASGFSSIQAETNSTVLTASAVLGSTTGAAYGVSGQVEPGASAEAGVYGVNQRTNGGHGILGDGFNGVVGQTGYSQGYGVFGTNSDQIPPLGLSVGVAGVGYNGVLGEDMYLGAVLGAYGVFANGDMGSSGLKTFLIDHPEDPENKLIRHFSVESNEVLNIYRGTVICDEEGNATVELPEYFALINKNESYQLTPIGSAANLYISKEISNGSFSIGGANPGMKVSWTVTAERNDPYLQKYPEKREDVVEKSDRRKGKVFMPQLYGLDISKKVTMFPAQNPGETQIEVK